MRMLMDENVKAVTTGVLQQMELDLMQCEMFTASDPVPGMGEGVRHDLCLVFRTSTGTVFHLRFASII